jgi:hypothetical protein
MGGGIIILSKKGPLFVWRLSVFLLFLGVRVSSDSRQNKKKEKGARQKKNGGN